MTLIIAAVLIGLIPAVIAKKKGHSFVSWWVYGMLLPFIALPHALIMQLNQNRINLSKIGPWMMGLGWVVTVAAVSMSSVGADPVISENIAFGVPWLLGVFGIATAKRWGRAPQLILGMGLIFLLFLGLELVPVRVPGLPWNPSLRWAILCVPLLLGGFGIGAAIQRRCVPQWSAEIGLFFLLFLGLEGFNGFLGLAGT